MLESRKLGKKIPVPDSLGSDSPLVATENVDILSSRASTGGHAPQPKHSHTCLVSHNSLEEESPQILLLDPTLCPHHSFLCRACEGMENTKGDTLMC